MVTYVTDKISDLYDCARKNIVLEMRKQMDQFCLQLQDLECLRGHCNISLFLFQLCRFGGLNFGEVMVTKKLATS